MPSVAATAGINFLLWSAATRPLIPNGIAIDGGTTFMTSGHRRAFGCAITALLATEIAFPFPAVAQTRPGSLYAPGAIADSTDALDEILVTARRREERAVDVSASLDVFGGEDLEEAGVKSLVDLQYLSPGLKISPAASGARITLRGVGTNIASGSPSIAAHVDGIYVPDLGFAAGEVFDVGRIEVLKGPQGTLYGRNATGGAINVVTMDPRTDRFSADGWIGVGSNKLVNMQAGMSVPLGEGRGGLRLSGAYANDDGYTKNINPAGGEVDARDYKGGRVRLAYDLTDNLTADVTVQYSVDMGTVAFGSSNNPESPVFASLPPQRQDIRNINLDSVPHMRREGTLLSATLALDLGEATLKSITGLVDINTEQRADVDGAGGLIGRTDARSDQRLFSQELQLSGGGAGKLAWTAGLYYSTDKNSVNSVETDADFPDPAPYVFTDLTQRTRNRSAAAFGEVTVPLTDALSITAGARYTKERQSLDSNLAVPLFVPEPFAFNARVENDGFAPKLLVTYKPREGSQFYASATRGFKNGGVNIDTEIQPYKPEKIWAYEVGTKNLFANGRVELNLAGFYYDYTDLQLRSVIFTPTGFFTKINNASSASVYGLEVAAAYSPTDWFRLDFAGAYIDSNLKDFVLPGTTTPSSGLPLPLTPKTSFTVGAELKTHLAGGQLKARIDLSRQSKVYFPNFTDINRERQAAYALLNANLRYDLPGEKVFVALVGRNLTNKTYLSSRFFYEGFSDLEIYGAPRSIEARIGFKY